MTTDTTQRLAAYQLRSNRPRTNRRRRTSRRRARALIVATVATLAALAAYHTGHDAGHRAGAQQERTRAADARLLDFAAGLSNHVSEEDLTNASPAALAAAAARLD